MIRRNLEPVLRAQARLFPVVTVTGPRQSGKTTLCRKVFPRKPYVSLEPLDNRTFAREDPRGFLAANPAGAVIDEVQHVPELLTYIQEQVDEDPSPGRYVLTGSQHFGLTATVAQSLAGRTAVLHLLPLGLDEIGRFPETSRDLLSVLFAGGFPRIHDRGIPASRWLANYVTTYIERDVRQLMNVGDLTAFTAFVRMVAGATAQEVNLSRLGGDAGVSHNTARSWLSVLEASFLVAQLPAWTMNVRKRVVKAHKLYVLDSGLACHLLGIRTPAELAGHPLRGAVFESWVASEIVKARAHRGLEPRLYHFRDAKGLEVHLILDMGARRVLVEAKSGLTIASDWFDGLRRVAQMRGKTSAVPELRLVYGGDARQRRDDVLVIPWSEIAGQDWGKA